MKNKRSRFKNLAEHRVNRIIHYIRILSNLSNNRAYEYTDKAVKKIFNVIEAEINTCKDVFENGFTKPRKFIIED